MSCCVGDCGATATHYPVIIVPAIGFPATPRNCLELIVGMACCHQHAAEQDLAHDMPAESRARIRGALAGIGKAYPDFKRARVEARQLGDEQWRKLQAARAECHGGGQA